MTRQRVDEHSTEFGLWLRKQKEIDSSLGFVTSNLDYIWRNYKDGLWMLIEEKRFMRKMKLWQQEVFGLVIRQCKKDPNFRGFHLIQFERTSPDDGKIFLNGKEIDRTNLIRFLRFEEYFIKS